MKKFSLVQRCLPHPSHKNNIIGLVPHPLSSLRNKSSTSHLVNKTQQTNNSGGDSKKTFSASSDTSSSKFKRYGTWTLVALLGVAGWMELNYRTSPEFSAGDSIRKYFYGNPYRNYINTKNGVVLELSVDNNNATIADERPGSNTQNQEKKLVYISEEGNIHVIIPDNFVQPGLLINESSAFRDSGKFRLTDITGNDLLFDWNRVNTVLRTNLQSTMTPTEEILKACSYKYIESLLERVDDVQVQRTEYLHIPNPKFGLRKSNAPQPLDPIPSDLPYKRISNKDGMDMVCVVSSHPVAQGSQQRVWRADLWFLAYPFVYHFCVNQPEQAIHLAKFMQENKIDPHSEQAASTIRQVAEQLSNQPDVIEQITKKTLSPDRLTADPEKISLMLRNDVLRVHHDSFCRFISV